MGSGRLESKFLISDGRRTKNSGIAETAWTVGCYGNGRIFCTPKHERLDENPQIVGINNNNDVAEVGLLDCFLWPTPPPAVQGYRV